MSEENFRGKNKYTFWNLLKEYKIEIPIIQRDYAQGRISDDATAIREEFLDSIYSALTEKEPLDFDFIYGTVEEDTLYPLDGQQRLTTFYLLHWYLAEKESRMDEAADILGKFSYTTRTSSRAFCKMLTELNYTPEQGISVSDYIKDENGYFRTWDSDPTISHMLIMLDDIHNKFFDVEQLFDSLISEDECLLTFNYLPMEHYALTDELYIKMNARGKALSVFENFKAKFIHHLKGLELPYKHFEDSIDREWTDLLWDYRDEDNTIDKQFMNLFCYFTEMQYLETEEPREGDSPYSPSKIRPLIEYYQTEEVVEDLYELFDLWKSKEDACKCLNTILSCDREQGKVRIFDASSADIFSAIVHGENVTLANKIILYTIMRRMIELGETEDSESLKDATRIVRNFLVNTRQFVRKKSAFTPDLRYGRHAIPIMQNLVTEMIYTTDPYVSIRDEEFDSINAEILAKERDKAELILSRVKSKAIIHAFEDSSLFRTSIFNVLPYIEKHLDKTVIDDLEILFGIYKGEKIYQALLSVDDYGIYIGSSFYGERYFYGQKDNWYSILTYTGDMKYSEFICKFIEQYESTNSDNTVDRLNEVINANLPSISKEDWRYVLVKYFNTVRMWNGYIDNKFMIIALESLSDGTKLAHRSNGSILVGYHVIPEYLEVISQASEICSEEVRGFSGESSGYIHLNISGGIDLSITDNGGYEIINMDDEDDDLVSKTVERFNDIDLSDMDRVEQIMLMISLLQENYKKENTKRHK